MSEYIYSGYTHIGGRTCGQVASEIIIRTLRQESEVLSNKYFCIHLVIRISFLQQCQDENLRSLFSDVKRNMTDEAKSVCNNTKLKDITEMSIYKKLLNFT